MIPSLRLTLALCAGAVCFFLAPLFAPLYYAGVLFDCFLAVGCLVDWALLRQANALAAERSLAPTLSPPASNPVTLSAINRASLPFRFHLKDSPPSGFQVDRSLFSATLRPGECWMATYQAVPSERGDFTFGRLYLRC